MPSLTSDSLQLLLLRQALAGQLRASHTQVWQPLSGPETGQRSSAPLSSTKLPSLQITRPWTPHQPDWQSPAACAPSACMRTAGSHEGARVQGLASASILAEPPPLAPEHLGSLPGAAPTAKEHGPASIGAAPGGLAAASYARAEDVQLCPAAQATHEAGSVNLDAWCWAGQAKLYFMYIWQLPR